MLGITKYLWITFPVGTYLTSGSFDNTDIDKLTSGSGTELTAAAKVATSAHPDYQSDDATMSYLIPITETTSSGEKGSGWIVFDDSAQPDLTSERIRVNFTHNGGVGYTVSGKAATNTSGTFTVVFNQDLVDQYAATANTDLAPPKITVLAISAGASGTPVTLAAPNTAGLTAGVALTIGSPALTTFTLAATDITTAADVLTGETLDTVKVAFGTGATSAPTNAFIVQAPQSGLWNPVP